MSKLEKTNNQELDQTSGGNEIRSDEKEIYSIFCGCNHELNKELRTDDKGLLGSFCLTLNAIGVECKECKAYTTYRILEVED